jgi:hypothetical protein
LEHIVLEIIRYKLDGEKGHSLIRLSSLVGCLSL